MNKSDKVKMNASQIILLGTLFVGHVKILIFFLSFWRIDCKKTVAGSNLFIFFQDVLTCTAFAADLTV